MLFQFIAKLTEFLKQRRREDEKGKVLIHGCSLKARVMIDEILGPGSKFQLTSFYDSGGSTKKTRKRLYFVEK